MSLLPYRFPGQPCIAVTGLYTTKVASGVKVGPVQPPDRLLDSTPYGLLTPDLKQTKLSDLPRTSIGVFEPAWSTKVSKDSLSMTTARF